MSSWPILTCLLWWVVPFYLQLTWKIILCGRIRIMIICPWSLITLSSIGRIPLSLLLLLLFFGIRGCLSLTRCLFGGSCIIVCRLMRIWFLEASFVPLCALCVKNVWTQHNISFSIADFPRIFGHRCWISCSMLSLFAIFKTAWGCCISRGLRKLKLWLFLVCAIFCIRFGGWEIS